MMKMKMKCSVVFILMVAFHSVCSWSCSHTKDLDRIKHVKVPKAEGTNDRLRIRRNTEGPFTEKFTMEVVYDSSVTSGLNTTVRQRIQNTVIPKLKEFFETTLSVRPLAGSLTFNRDCTSPGTYYVLSDGFEYCTQQCAETTTCGTADIPTDHLNRCRECNGNGASQCTESGSDGSGVDASFVLYVSAKTTGSCPDSVDSGSTLAFAGSCEMEDEFDRPIAGYTNFCPVSIDGSQSDEYLLTVAKHELLHALGFSSGLFSWWRDENGEPRTTRDSDGSPIGTSTDTLKEVTYTDWDTFNGPVSHSVDLLVTPKIVEEGKRHFNCSTLEGVQLEDQGGAGTAGSHWEARITKGEGMNGVIGTAGVFSRLTFALLEDSGWYAVNYTLAEQLVWGRNTGCELAAGSCGGYMKYQQQKNESISPFCNYPRSPNTLYRCTITRNAVSNCNLATYSGSLPAEYQYFQSSADGGAFATSDYCPFQREFSNTLCADTANAESGLSNSLAETFGPRSRCVEHGVAWRATEGGSFIQQPFTKAGCYNYTCSNGQVTIHILDQSYTCTTAGEELTVSQTSNGVTYMGSIICPSCLEICYDDFDNCPEAAQVYSEFVSSIGTTMATLITSSTTSISSSSSSSSSHTSTTSTTSSSLSIKSSSSSSSSSSSTTGTSISTSTSSTTSRSLLDKSIMSTAASLTIITAGTGTTGTSTQVKRISTSTATATTTVITRPSPNDNNGSDGSGLEGDDIDDEVNDNSSSALRQTTYSYAILIMLIFSGICIFI